MGASFYNDCLDLFIQVHTNFNPGFKLPSKWYSYLKYRENGSIKQKRPKDSRSLLASTSTYEKNPLGRDAKSIQTLCLVLKKPSFMPKRTFKLYITFVCRNSFTN
jgi:hypothetical protein